MIEAWHSRQVRLLETPNGDVVHANILEAGPADASAVCVTAGVHGDEVDAVNVAVGVIRSLSLDQLRKRVIVLPIQNPMAFGQSSRSPAEFVQRSAYEHHGFDIFSRRPATPEGGTTGLLRSRILDSLPEIEAVIDMHTPARGGRYAPVGIVPKFVSQEAATLSTRIAEAFGCLAIWEVDYDGSLNLGSLGAECARQSGAAFLLVELGEGGVHSPPTVALGVRGIMNALRVLGALPGGVDETPSPLVIRRTQALRSPAAGLLDVSVLPGHYVSAGDRLASVTGWDGSEAGYLIADAPGLVLRISTHPVIWEGEHVIEVASVGGTVD